MSITTVSSKGQVVLPKPIREALHIRPGAALGVRVDGTRVILETAGRSWQPLNPAGVRLSIHELCKPVDLRSADERRAG
jgi:AbrB family looped-hinge helix DNA binding protein